MDWIEEIISNAKTAGDLERIVTSLKLSRGSSLPNYAEIESQLNPRKHCIFDKSKRPDRKVKNDNGGGYKSVPVVRIAIAMQKLIVRRAVAFSLGTPPLFKCYPSSNEEQRLFDLIKMILKKNKVKSLNRKIGRNLFSYTEVAECWYALKADTHNSYGEPAGYKIKCRIFSPKNGDALYPFFDEYGDLVAFSRSFSRKGADAKRVDYFETYTNSYKYLFVNNGDRWELENKEVNVIGKIPVIYATQETTEWQDVQHLIEELETTLSNFGDTNAYHASPKVLVKGEIKSFAKKGDPASIINLDKDADASYLTWNSAPDSIKLEIDTLLRLIYTISQTPDISFDAIKSLGSSISGEAMERLLLDALLKVDDKKEILEEFLDRRTSLLCAMVGYYSNLRGTAEQITIENEIRAFNVSDKTQSLNRIKSITGGKPLVSQKTGIGLVAEIYPAINAEDEAKMLKEEEERESNRFTHGSFEV